MLFSRFYFLPHAAIAKKRGTTGKKEKNVSGQNVQI